MTKDLLSCVVIGASLVGSGDYSISYLTLSRTLTHSPEDSPKFWYRRAAIDRVPPLVTSRERCVNAYVTGLPGMIG